MKYLLVAIAALAILFLISQAFSFRATNKVEGYSYDVVKRFDGFEIRKYEAAYFASYTMATSTYKESSSLGFRTLAGYIFGKNEEGVKMPMTSPVAMDISDSVTMRFLMPSNYDQESLPVPSDKNIRIEKRSEKLMAAITFGGWANDEKIAIYTAELKGLLKENNIKYKNEFSYFGYNPPFEVVNRRNEIVVEIEY
ncbi:MAG: heme-binding protein [Vicingaceae bacterium]